MQWMSDAHTGERLHTQIYGYDAVGRSCQQLSNDNRSERLNSEELKNENKKSNQYFLRLPEVVKTLAQDVKVLRWDEERKWFEVVDGPRFEERFNSLRCIRGKRTAHALDRPFARIHSHFPLLRGERWARTGSTLPP